MAKIIVLVGYARSGVTVLNRCLSGDDRLICLSEINSRFTCPTLPNTPSEQLHKWYNVKINRSSTLSEIEAVSDFASSSDKTLIIRDWSFASFVPLEYNNFQPTKSLNTLHDITAHFHTKNVGSFAFVRNPIDIWLSMNNSVKSFHDMRLAFLKEFVLEIINKKIPIFKYEDLCLNTHRTLDDMYNIIGKKVPSKIHLSRNVIGDTNYPKSSRGANSDRINLLPRREITNEEKRFLKNETQAKEILELLAYSDNLLS